MITVYGFSRVNSFARGRTRDLRILWALEEMGLPYQVKGMDHPAKDLSTDAYRRLSPFEQIPAIDDDGLVLSESGAILLYLARKSGKLIPADDAGQAQVMRWCFAAQSTVELPILYLMILGFIGKDDPGVKGPVEFTKQWAHRHLGNLERWMEGREYVATDGFTVADILMSHVLSVNQDEALFEPYPRVRGYLERCEGRAAWEKTLEAYCGRVEAG